MQVAQPPVIRDLSGVDELILGLSWDMIDPDHPVDLDASCVLFNAMGQLVDAVYYNQLEIPHVRHSGDARTGQESAFGFDEMITIQLGSVDESVSAFVLVVTSHSGGSFRKVQTAGVKVMNATTSQVISELNVGCHGKFTALVMCIVYREDPSQPWRMKEVGRRTRGHTFMKIEPQMREELSFFIPLDLQAEFCWDMSSTKSFDMKKGSVVQFSDAGDLRLEIGWRVKKGDGLYGYLTVNSADLQQIGLVPVPERRDAGSNVYPSRANASIEYFRRQGDVGSPQTQSATIKLRELPDNVASVFCWIVPASSSGLDFRKLKHPFVRLVISETEREMCRFNLEDLKGDTELLCVIFRLPEYPGGGRLTQDWYMKAIADDIDCDADTSDSWALTAKAIHDRLKKIYKKQGKKRMKERRLIEAQRARVPETVPAVVPHHHVTFTCHAENVDKMDFLGKSDPYFYLYSSRQAGQELYKSPIIKKTLNPQYAEATFVIREDMLSEPCTLAMWDWDRFSRDDAMGGFSFSVSDVLAGTKTRFDIIRPDKKGPNKHAGVFEFDSFVMGDGEPLECQVPSEPYWNFTQRMNELDLEIAYWDGLAV